MDNNNNHLTNGNQNKAPKPSLEDNPIVSLPSYLQVQVAQTDLSLFDDNEISSSSNVCQQQQHSRKIDTAKQEYQTDFNGNSLAPISSQDLDPVKRFRNTEVFEKSVDENNNKRNTMKARDIDANKIVV